LGSVREFGGRLFDAVFHDELRVALANSLVQAEACPGMGSALQLPFFGRGVIEQHPHSATAAITAHPRGFLSGEGPCHRIKAPGSVWLGIEMHRV
jgi:hypothetical protein